MESSSPSFLVILILLLLLLLILILGRSGERDRPEIKIKITITITIKNGSAVGTLRVLYPIVGKNRNTLSATSWPASSPFWTALRRLGRRSARAERLYSVN